MKAWRFTMVVVGALVIYFLLSGLFLRMTTPYNGGFVPLSETGMRLSRLIYGPLIWTVENAPPSVSGPLQTYLEIWGCRFPTARVVRPGK